MPNVDKTELRNRLADAKSSEYIMPVPFVFGCTTLALPFEPLTLDGLYCIDPGCNACREAQAGELVVNAETWPPAVTAIEGS